MRNEVDSLELDVIVFCVCSKKRLVTDILQVEENVIAHAPNGVCSFGVVDGASGFVVPVVK